MFLTSFRCHQSLHHPIYSLCMTLCRIVSNFTLIVFQIKIPLLRDVLRLIAYGESEIDMKKSCLQRIYPIPSASNHNVTRQHTQNTKKLIQRHSFSNHVLPKTMERLPLEVSFVALLFRLHIIYFVE